MSAIANTLPTRRFRTQPLPSALDHPAGPDQPHRRQAINGYRPARAALERVRDHQGLSRDVLEVVTRALGD